MPPRQLLPFLRLITRLGLASGRSWTSLLAAATSFMCKIARQPQVAELLRFIFLGTIVETGRKIAQRITEFGAEFFVVKAEFSMGDFAYDWVVTYLEHHRVWNESRSFKVVARNAISRPLQSSNLGKIDGHPDPIYEPATAQSPSFFRWRGYWMTINKTTAGLSHYDTSEQIGGTLVIAVWSRDRRILDEFVSAAREFYVNSHALPRKQVSGKAEPSGALLTAYFEQSDLAHDWMLEYLRSSSALQDVMEYKITTKQGNLGWGTGPKDAVRYMPAPDSVQRYLFTSSTTGRSTWIQVVVHTGIESWDSNRMIGGSITITLHSSDRDVLADLIECARVKYLEKGTSRVTVHLADSSGRWAKTVTKSRRALTTLILPTNVKEMILADAQEFWRARNGIAWPASPTVAAISFTAPLERGRARPFMPLRENWIYFISLASPGIDDYSLGRLISDTPSKCILVIEDIDCAFPSREEPGDEDEEEPERDRNGNPIKFSLMPPKSAVTLSGLLNVLDSVSSEEGRLTFATTNHIANLDPALIRAGRMDLKACPENEDIQYGLATTEQIEQVFRVFFPPLAALEEESGRLPGAPYTDEDLDRYASEFAAAIPSEMFSIAQVQGYLLTKKQDVLAAVQGVQDWLVAQHMERRAISDAKRKWRADVARWRRGFEEPPQAVNAWQLVTGEVGEPEQAAPVPMGGVPTQASAAASVADIVDVLVSPRGSSNGSDE
ncbi:hypothetical protein C8R44DRAFT_865415 [Mycena epipterygia]|nr:hypothetical protein C8R44DRAFT_865415 [Mycena epipterygia]